jgi:hypothetical protein
MGKAGVGALVSGFVELSNCRNPTHRWCDEIRQRPGPRGVLGAGACQVTSRLRPIHKPRPLRAQDARPSPQCVCVAGRACAGDCPGGVGRRVQQRAPRWGNVAVIAVQGFWPSRAGTLVVLAPWSKNGRILLVILFPRHMVVVTVSDFQYSWTCNDGLNAALWTTL